MSRKLFVVLAMALAIAALPAASWSGDAFVKFGIAVNKINEHFTIGDRWQFSGGSDWKIKDTVGIGVEVQFAYRTIEEEVAPGVIAKFRSIPLNFFGNVKFKPELEGAVHPFVGAGLGVMSSINTVTVTGADVTFDSTHDAGIHFMGGIELGSKDTEAFLVEFEAARRLKSGGEFLYVLYGGIRF